MYKVREAKIEDILRIHELAKELLDQSPYAGIEPDDTKFKRTVAFEIGSKMGAVFVVVNDEDIPEGFLIGITEPLFFSKKRVATDLCFYVRPKARGYGAFLARRFIKWAKKIPSVVNITMGISSGSGDADRLGIMYERMGLEKVGGLYTQTMRTDK